MNYKNRRKLKIITEPQKVFDYACYWLNRYPCSAVKLKERLARKCRNEKIINNVILRLKELNYLDDKRLASNIISSYIKKGYGKKRINMKIYEKKIFDKDIIKTAWDENKHEDEKEIISSLIENRARHYNLNESKGRKALIGYLLRRGFKYDDVIEVFRKKIIS